MRTEFGGENLSDAANGVAKKTTALVGAAQLNFSPQTAAAQHRNVLGLSPTVLTALGKEFLYLRRNSGVFYGLVAPLVMVLLFATKLASRGNHWVFPAALAYTLLGLAPFAYNSFGLEGPGTQFYFLAPIRFRDVILAKNFMNFMMALSEGIAVLGIVTYLGSPPTGTVVAATLFWTIGTLLFNMTVGNLRSISSPKKINLNRTAGKPASPLSALIGLGVLIVASGVGAGFLFISNELDLQWLLLPAAAMYAGIGIAVYLAGLRSVDKYALDHRENMFEELCKQS
jgi:ABC-2 type transport system permease protein